MSNTGTITEKPIQSVGFQSTKRDEEFSNDLATQAHFSGLKDALMEVVKADSQVVQRPKRQSGKNSMITTFKIMKIVMKTLRETSDCQKEMNKIIKQEWKNVAHKQSDNSKEAKDNIESSGKYQYFSLVGSIKTCFTNSWCYTSHNKGSFWGSLCWSPQSSICF